MTTVRFLADESCDFNIVRALRIAAYDIVSISEMASGITDDAVSALANTETRIVLTEDKDFGQLVYSGTGPSSGVILIRFPGNARQAAENAVLNLVKTAAHKLPGYFVVVQPGKIRFSKYPPK